MGREALFLYIVAFFFSFAFLVSGYTDIKEGNLDLVGKQLFVINNVGISNEFETLNLNAICNNTNECNNGGSCYSNVCRCLPGTSGLLCETINGCSDLNCDKDKNAKCDFDKRNYKAFCKCPWGQDFDYEESKCKVCLCANCKEGQICIGQVKCEFVRSEKTCTCELPSYKFNPKKSICDSCSCGDNAEGCDFGDGGNKQCKCKSGYAENGYGCDRCSCDHGKYGECKFVNYTQVCTCDVGYVQDIDDCYKCTCGENGKCVWGGLNHEQKGCICHPGFMEIDGVCKDISDCYCGENSNCSINNKEKICSCQEGFTYVNGLCTDINECDNPKACPENTKCFNLIGSYNCTCADGFQPSKDKECEDIDECKNADSCTSSDTECFNTVGSFACVCKSGFATRDGIASNPICENKSSWKLGFGLLIGVFLAIIIGLIIMINRKS